MKRLIYLTSSLTYLTASSLNVIKLRDEAKDILHLSLYSQENIKCNIRTEHDLQDRIICSVSSENNITQTKKFDLFELMVESDKVIIEPKYKYRIYYNDKDFFDRNTFKDIKSYKRVDILFFKDEPSFLKYEKPYESLDFDISYNNQQELYIGVLNDDLTPIVSLKDAAKIDFIKKLFKKKDYVGVIKKADRELAKNNLYSSEILLYKIRALDKLLENKYENEYNYEDIQIACDEFINRYPSHKDLTEVYYYKIKSLFNSGKYKAAISLTNNLVENFKGDKYSEKAAILKAKNLFTRKKSRYASYKILKDILFSTKNTENALESAFILTGQYLEDKDSERAKKYFEKIFNFDKEYIVKNFEKSYRYAKKFAALKDYAYAFKIADILLKNKLDEELLKNTAYWAEKANKSDLAYKYYQEYLKEFPNGKYSDFVKERIDKVLLDIKDQNLSKKIEDIDNVIKKYSKEPIYKKALIQKVKLLIKNKKYQDVLELEDKLKDINATTYVEESAKNLLYRYLDEGDCIRSVKIVDKYKVTIDSKKLYLLSKCYYELARYKESLELSSKYLQSGKFDGDFRWYYIAIKSAFKMRDWSLVIKLYDDLQKLVEEKNIDKDIFYPVFYSFLQLDYIDRSLEILSKIEEKDKDDPKLLDVYYTLIKYYKKKNIDLSVVLYSKKLLALQKRLKVQAYSPVVDIILIKALKDLGKNKEALKYFADAYLSKNINDSQKAQLLYLAGEISLKMKNIKQAREFFIKCGTDVKSTMWQKLCSESLKIIEDK